MASTSKTSAGETRVASATAAPHAARAAPSKEAHLAKPAPAWVTDAVFYQIFPERFCNGDPSNDPTRESLEFPENVNEAWRVSGWTEDWYQRSEWERARGENFYEHGVFDRRYGGDLQGVLNKLDYLDSLGVNAIYFNPVFYARSLHKYDGNTYHHIDPHFGPDPAGDFKIMATETADPSTWKWTAADRLFLKLIREAHGRGIRIVIDGVFNHTGRGFFAFEDIVKKQRDSEYADWYVVHQFDNPETAGVNEFRYKGWWGVETLPEFANNQAGDNLHPGPKAYVFDATRRWMDPNQDGDPGDGIDGWRLDVASEMPSGFWREWNQLCRKLNPSVYTVAEHWHDAAEYLRETGFNAVMNYHGFAFPVKGFLIDGVTTPSDAAAMLLDRMREIPEGSRHAMLNLIDSHDTDRVASMAVNAPNGRPYVQPDRSDYDVTERVSPRHWDGYLVRKPNDRERRLQRLVAVMQAAFVGPPMMYYGTEAGMWGADDPCDRMPMVWPGAKYDDQQSDPLGRERGADTVYFETHLHSFYASLWKFRNANEALRSGDISVVAAEDDTRMLALRRARNSEAGLIVVFNRGEEPHELLLPTAAEVELTEVFTASGNADEIRLQRVEGGYRVRMPGLEAVVLQETRTDSPRRE